MLFLFVPVERGNTGFPFSLRALARCWGQGHTLGKHALLICDTPRPLALSYRLIIHKLVRMLGYLLVAMCGALSHDASSRWRARLIGYGCVVYYYILLDKVRLFVVERLNPR